MATDTAQLAALERELQIAREIQSSFLVKALPQPPGWEIAARFLPASQVAGDFYDAFPLVQNRRTGLVIADVSGKGVGAALFMALVRSLVRAFAQQHYNVNWADLLDGQDNGATNRRAMPSVGAIALMNAMTLTNEYLIRNHGEAGMFATLFFGVLDPATGALAYINAGHNPPYLVGARGVQAQLDPTGPALGMLAGAGFEIQHAHIERGETLVAYTDGVTEARNPRREFYGDERLAALIAAPVPSASAALARIEASVREFAADAPQSDDITLLAAHRTAT